MGHKAVLCSLTLILLSTCGHKPFKPSTIDRPNSINYSLRFSGGTPIVDVIINSQRGSREFSISPVPRDATSTEFWTALRSSIQMSLGSMDNSHPDFIKIFCFPTCHFSYQAGSASSTSFKMGPSLFPKIQNIRQKIAFPIHMNIHYSSPYVFTTYCGQSRTCDVPSETMLYEQFTYWGPTYPVQLSDDLPLPVQLLFPQNVSNPTQSTSLLSTLIQKLGSLVTHTPQLQLPTDLHIFTLPDTSVPIFILKNQNFVILSQSTLASEAIMLRCLLALFLNTQKKLEGTDAVIDALWVFLGSQWNIISDKHMQDWLKINQYYATVHHSQYSRLALSYLASLQQGKPLTSQTESLIPAISSPPRAAYLSQLQDKIPIIIWSHPEVRNIIDEPILRPVAKGQGPIITSKK